MSTSSRPSQNVVADPYSEQKIRFEDGTMIRFGDPDAPEGAWDVRLNEDGELTIRLHTMGTRSASAVIPSSANYVILRAVQP